MGLEYEVDLFDDWHEPIADMFAEDLARDGVAIKRTGKAQMPVYEFSGFYHQGSGACFAGSVEDWPKWLAAVGYSAAEQRRILRVVAAGSFELTAECGGRYHHQRVDSYEQSLRDEHVLVGRLWDNVRDHWESYCSDKASDLFRTLEKEYEYQSAWELARKYVNDASDARETLKHAIKQVRRARKVAASAIASHAGKFEPSDVLDAALAIEAEITYTFRSKLVAYRDAMKDQTEALEHAKRQGIEYAEVLP